MNNDENADPNMMMSRRGKDVKMKEKKMGLKARNATDTTNDETIDAGVTSCWGQRMDLCLIK